MTMVGSGRSQSGLGKRCGTCVCRKSSGSRSSAPLALRKRDIACDDSRGRKKASRGLATGVLSFERHFGLRQWCRTSVTNSVTFPHPSNPLGNQLCIKQWLAERGCGRQMLDLRILVGRTVNRMIILLTVRLALPEPPLTPPAHAQARHLAVR
jgi:hypothetical protein